MSIPALALPHGVYVYTNDFITIESRPLQTFEKLNRYDHVIVQNELYKQTMAKFGLDSRKILIMGSARYCSEWMEQNKKILPRKIRSNAASAAKLKVVFMTTKARYRIHIERMIKTFEMLSRFEGIEVLIKPHTRTTKEAALYENVPLSDASDVSSVELCEWADIVMVIGSSIIIEPLIQGKPVLYLKYLHENTTQYEDFGACWIIHSEDELQKALSLLLVSKLNVPYSEENVNRFLSDIVYGGPQKRDVLQDYEQFIVNCAAN
ncbi:MAG: CDP-glycerol glycerophosphotransferase family protein [Desulfobacterales bacterium]|nr:MAG: CDP-glycerol glycerophosphotransferase family protein [Desulfobacterales bacterium]